jgi:outer membrane protein assembly factor BamB
MSRSLRIALACALAVGCGGAAGLSPTFPDNQQADLDAVLARVSAAGSADEPVAVGLTEDQLYAFDLRAQRQRWSQPVQEPRTAPYLAGDLVVLHEGARIVARRLSDGAVALTLGDDNYQLVGAAGEGRLGVIVLSTGGAVGARSRVLLLNGGGVSSEVALDAAAGGPAVRGGIVFVPWGNQNVTMLDGTSGREVARLRFLDGVVGHARATGAGVFFGQSGVGRVAAQVDRTGTGWFVPEVARLPGQPPLWRDAYAPPAGPRSATHRIRLEWAPAAGSGAVRTTDDTLYLTFYRLVFGLAQEALAPRWVYEHPADVVGAAARDGGVMLADAEGGLTFVGADGRPRWSAETNVRPTVVALRLDGLALDGSASGPALPPIADQLLGAVQSTDARLVPARAFAVRLLAGQDEPAVTERLLVLCEDRSIPEELRRAACESLGGRTMDADAIVAALQRRASYLSDTRPPPVAALAAVAARQRERRAVPLLLGHLRDPATSITDIGAIAAALAELGDASALTPLQDFLWLYHAEAEDEALATALGAVAAAVTRLGGDAGREEVQRIADAPFTAPRTRAALTAALRPEGAR